MNSRSTRRARKATISIALVGALSLGGVVAAPASASTAAPAPSTTSSTLTLSATGSTSSGPVINLSGAGATKAAPGSASTNALPALAFRLAVRAGMAVLKRTAVTWYRAIITKVNQGRSTFVYWWNNSVPNWIKVTLGAAGGGVTGNAVYDALLWVLGLN